MKRFRFEQFSTVTATPDVTDNKTDASTFLSRTKYRRDSSVGRASDWRSEGPWFNPGSRQIFSAPSPFQLFYIRNRWQSYEFNSWHSRKTRPRWDSNPQSSDSKSDALSIRPRGHIIPSPHNSYTSKDIYIIVVTMSMEWGAMDTLRFQSRTSPYKIVIFTRCELHCQQVLR